MSTQKSLLALIAVPSADKLKVQVPLIFSQAATVLPMSTPVQRVDVMPVLYLMLLSP